MDQENIRIQILKISAEFDWADNFISNDKNLEQFPKSYDVIMKKLNQKNLEQWVLFDFKTGNPITSENLQYYDQINACRIVDIPVLFSAYQKCEEQKDQINKLRETVNKFENALKKNEKLSEQIEYLSLDEIEKRKLLQKQQEEIQKLQQQLSESRALNIKQQSLAVQIRQQSVGFNNQLVVSQGEINKLKKENEQLFQFKSKSEKLSEDFYNSQNQCQQQIGKIEELRMQLDHASQEQQKSNDEKRYLQSESAKYKKELKQSLEQIDHLIIQQSHQAELELNQKNELQKKSQNDCCNVNDFYTDEQQQEEKQMHGNQIKFLHNIIIKQLDEIKRTRDINSKIDRSTTFLQSNEFEVYSITLKEQQFQKCINEKNFFFRQNCINKQRCYYAQSINEQQMSIIAHGQQINIQKVFTLSKSDHEAIDTILNILIVQGYFTLFQRDLQQNTIQQFQQIWNLRIPKQFLVKDQMDNYYVYQECLQINIKNFIPFQTTSPMDQYISSFYKYFYFATNKNLALTECQYGEQTNKNFALTECQYGEINNNTQIIILSIIMHSNYEKGFSPFDEGKTKIEEFEEMLKAPEGKAQKYWSDQLQNLAKKVWNDPQQQQGN